MALKNREDALAYGAAYRVAHREELRAYRAAHREESRAYQVAHQEELRAYQAVYRAAHKEKAKAYRAAHHAAHKEKNRASCAAYYAAHKKEIQAQQVTYNKCRKETNPQYCLVINLRSRINSALRGRDKSARTRELIGCSIPEWLAHLEKQFRPGMTWENYGPVWHVDHVRPCASFDLTDPIQQRACFNWSNTQPLFSEENLKKGARFTPPVP